MRLRELTPAERREVEKRRAEARATLSRIQDGWVPGEAALAAAPFLDNWEERAYPTDGKACLAGLCHGHPILGDRWVCTSPLLHRGETWALTENRLYILGRQRTDTDEQRLLKVLSGRRGVGRPIVDLVETPAPSTPVQPPAAGYSEADDELPDVDPLADYPRFEKP